LENRTYRHDLDGALTHITTENLRSVPATIQTTELVYDAREKLVEIGLPDGRKIANGYYPDSWERLFFTAPGPAPGGGEKTLQLWDPHTANPVQDIDAVGATIAEYIQGSPMDEALALVSGARTHAYVTDERGSVRGLATPTGEIVNTSTYFAFGLPRRELLTLANRLRYTGREWELRAAIQYTRNRHYLPLVGRFSRADPTPFRDSWNVYTYARANPVSHVDPSGLKIPNCPPSLCSVVAKCIYDQCALDCKAEFARESFMCETYFPGDLSCVRSKLKRRNICISKCIGDFAFYLECCFNAGNPWVWPA
jgi:RHS repeat-associated protein